MQEVRTLSAVKHTLYSILLLEPSLEVFSPCTEAALVYVSGSCGGPHASTTTGVRLPRHGFTFMQLQRDLILLVYPSTQRISSGSFCSCLSQSSALPVPRSDKRAVEEQFSKRAEVTCLSL